MMIRQTLTLASSKHSLPVRAYRGAPSLAVCLLSLLGSSAGCTGEIDATTDPLSGSVTNPGKSGTAAPGTTSATPGTTPRPTPAASGADDEIGNDNVQGVDGEATSGRRRGGAGRARAADRDDDEIDAGADEVADAGEVDAAVEADAGGIDAGAVVDAGPAADATAP